MSKRIKYIGFYNHLDSTIQRVSALSAVNKMNYVIECLNELDYEVDIVSPSWVINGGNRFFIPSSKDKIGRNNYIYTPSIDGSLKFFQYLAILMASFWLFFYLVFKSNKNERIIVYHSLWLSVPLFFAKIIRKFYTILEVEEIYSDVSALHKKFAKYELRVINQANSYIYSTELLEEKVNRSKPSIILYGNYKAFDRLGSFPSDGKIHLLYAGIIDSHKAGAFNAIESAIYLNENYVLHIIGFGEVRKLEDRILKINEISKCKVYYDGSKFGEDFIEYSQKCHVGLSTQKMSGSYLDTSFPSKILTYLSLGLRVISCRVKCVEMSKINTAMVYYSDDNPKSIAQAIMNIKFDVNFDSVKLIHDLDMQFKVDLKIILENE